MYSSTHSLISALDGGEWSASRPGRFTPRERAPGAHWIGYLVDSKAGLDAVVKRKILSLCRDSIARRYTTELIPAPMCDTDCTIYICCIFRMTLIFDTV
jgi:hypothetical protein